MVGLTELRKEKQQGSVMAELMESKTKIQMVAKMDKKRVKRMEIQKAFQMENSMD